MPTVIALFSSLLFLFPVCRCWGRESRIVGETEVGGKYGDEVICEAKKVINLFGVVLEDE
jgi:hypothetical protein